MNQFVEAWKDVVMKNYTNFSGRLGRGDYWRFFAVTLAIFVVLYILMLIADIFVYLVIVAWLAMLLPSIAAGVRRLHDSGKSGLLYLLGLIPCVGGIIVLVLLAQPGTPGNNEYGMPPVAPVS